MKYLNKIVFINSADKSLKYAEVELDGNVHFIGTQGVGKSTLLRAILFFYNADIQKLGIPREKKNYNEYYFPYQNSYIIYELQTEAGKFCVVSFKSQGRVAFRFIDAAYSKTFFIDSEGKAFDSWDKTREVLGRSIHSTRIVSNYEEYRNILYGNNRELSNEFRKYALIESRQYQNIPRTIANVFLNAKLDAEFVKETIIKSLNEEEVKVDLTTYSQVHLKDFEADLNDIRKWTDKNRAGDNDIEKQADKVATNFNAYRYLELQLKTRASQLGWAFKEVNEKLPKAQEQLEIEYVKREKVVGKLKELTADLEKKKAKIQSEIGAQKSKLNDIKIKREEYEVLKIDDIIQRVSKKNTVDLERNNLVEEKKILSSQFIEIQQRYDALLQQLENQKVTFENTKSTEKNNKTAQFVAYKEELNSQYEAIFTNIQNQNSVALETATTLINSIEKKINDQKILRSEVKHKRFFEQEMETTKVEISTLKESNVLLENQIFQSNELIKSLQKEWESALEKLRDEFKRNIENQQNEKAKKEQLIADIDAKIENSKDSFYGWLNQHVPNWDKTIGKVIDEENVLFQKGLNPTLAKGSDLNFYGIQIDTSEINKEVKTVAVLKKDKLKLENELAAIQKEMVDLNTKLKEDEEKLKKKFQPKIRAQKDQIQGINYSIEQNTHKVEELTVRRTEWETKASTEQKNQLEKLEEAISKFSEEKLKAEEALQKLKVTISKSIDAKRKEREATIKTEQLNLVAQLQLIDAEIQANKKEIDAKIAVLKIEQKEELNTKGADTKRLGEIDLRLSELQEELNFIDANRDKVAEFNKDKRELFDREEEFKNAKQVLEKKLETESEKSNQQKLKFQEQLDLYDSEIESLTKSVTSLQGDIVAFQQFMKTEVYQQIEVHLQAPLNEFQTEHSCSQLINELNAANNSLMNRFNDLQEAIHKFASNFQESNVFNFKVKFVLRSDYFDFAEELKEFIDENKIVEYKQRVEERFARIISQIGKETNALIEKEGEISKVIHDINNDFVNKNFVGAIKSMELKTDKSANSIFQLLVEIKNFNDNNVFDLGKPDLFSSNVQSSNNERAISLLVQLIKEMAISKEKEITLSDSFELLFKIVENDNDTGWVEKLTNVGSEGTDILVKAMINIMLLNVFKEKASRKNNDDFRLHCMMDEIGKLHPNNVKGILKFANDRNILLINSSPTSYNAIDYRYTYLLTKDTKNVTNVKRLVRKTAAQEPLTREV